MIKTECDHFQNKFTNAWNQMYSGNQVIPQRVEYTHVISEPSILCAYRINTLIIIAKGGMRNSLKLKNLICM